MTEVDDQLAELAGHRGHPHVKVAVLVVAALVGAGPGPRSLPKNGTITATGPPAEIVAAYEEELRC